MSLKKILNILKFVRNSNKKLGSITPALSFFSIYCSKIFCAPSKGYFLRDVFSQKTPSQIFSRIFLRQFYPKNVGKFHVLDPIQRRLDYFSKFFRHCSKKCLAGMWIRSRTRTRTQLLTIEFLHFQG